MTLYTTTAADKFGRTVYVVCEAETKVKAARLIFNRVGIILDKIKTLTT